MSEQFDYGPIQKYAERLDGPPAEPGRYQVGTDGRGHLVIEQAVCHDR